GGRGGGLAGWAHAGDREEDNRTSRSPAPTSQKPPPETGPPRTGRPCSRQWAPLETRAPRAGRRRLICQPAFNPTTCSELSYSQAISRLMPVLIWEQHLVRIRPYRLQVRGMIPRQQDSVGRWWEPTVRHLPAPWSWPAGRLSETRAKVGASAQVGTCETPRFGLVPHRSTSMVVPWCCTREQRRCPWRSRQPKRAKGFSP